MTQSAQLRRGFDFPSAKKKENRGVLAMRSMKRIRNFHQKCKRGKQSPSEK
jgi:hypothetical protein